MSKTQVSNRILTIGNATDQGAREYQDDKCGHRFEEDGSLLAVLADGMGGYFGGAVASKLAVKNFGDFYSSSTGRIPDRLEKSLHFANKVVSDKANDDHDLRDMGTTFVAVSISPGVLYWVSVGDSLLYLIRNGTLIQLNEEHSLQSKMERLYSKGKISKSELVSLKSGSALTSTLGRDSISEIDNLGVPTSLLDGDKLVIASDGILTLDKSKIVSMVSSMPTAQKAADSIVSLVINEGKKNQDNVTVVVISHQKENTRPVLQSKQTSDQKVLLAEDRKKWGIPVLIFLLSLCCVLLIMNLWSSKPTPRSNDANSSDGAIEGMYNDNRTDIDSYYYY